jgi:pimeloyl-ACP methyl ester carboxylesterase
MTATRRFSHGELTLALHELRAGSGTSLLLLHQLGGSSAEWGAPLEGWPGPVFALDFAGHGESERRAGGAYVPELLAADADVALELLGPCRLAGAGIGAYIALLLAGARPELVPAALLLPGRGLDGGGPLPDPTRGRTFIDTLDGKSSGGADPMVWTCDHDPRPPDYALAFASAARRLLLAEDGGSKPPWWEAIREASVTRRLATGVTSPFAALLE